MKLAFTALALIVDIYFICKIIFILMVLKIAKQSKVKMLCLIDNVISLIVAGIKLMIAFCIPEANFTISLIVVSIYTILIGIVMYNIDVTIKKEMKLLYQENI